MLGNLFNALVYEPLYNALVLIIDILPSADAGLAIVVLTLVVKIILLPLSIKATRTQLKMKEIEPQVKEIQQKHKDNREQQAMEMMSLYREAQVNPFSSIFVMIIQIIVIIPLFLIFRNGISEIDPTRLYSFVPEPEVVNVMFLGLINIANASLVLAALAAAAQFLQSHILLAAQDSVVNDAKTDKEKEDEANKEPSFGEQMQKSLKVQMRYVLPLIIGIVAYTTSAAIGIYFIVSALFTIGQELLVKRKIKENHEKHA